MRRQAVRTFALMLGVTLAGAPAARAGTITFGDAVRGFGAGGQFRPASEVRLRLGAQQGGAVQTQDGSTQGGGVTSSEQQSGSQPSGQGGTAVTTTTSADPTISQSGGQVQTVDLGDVTGTVCDCGEIPIPPSTPKGGIPWWPLVGIPLICLTGICTGEETPPETPQTPPNTPETPVPEPISLLLFGSGLLAVGAGARRRRGRRQLEQETISATAEEV